MIHLNVHSFHSILQGCGSIKNYVKKAKEYNHTALAITDYGTLSGTFELFQKCKEGGIKPIIGIEAYLCDNILEEKRSSQIILVKNEKGYKNLNKILYQAMANNFNEKPLITTDELIKNKEGLLISTSGINSKISQLLRQNKIKEAEDRFVYLKNIFQDDFYAEIQINEIPFQKDYNNFIISLAQKYNVTLVMTGNVHYVKPEDNSLQDVLFAISQKKSMNDSNFKKMNARHLFYFNENDFHQYSSRFGFNYNSDFINFCLNNTHIIGDKCNFEFDTNTEKYPKYEPTEDVISFFGKENNKVSTRDIIYSLAHAKLKQKLSDYHKRGVKNVTQEVYNEYYNRLNYELNVIDSKGMLDYFLVNWEIVRDYRNKGFEVGPARGCFVPGSRVKMSDDIYKPIDTIEIGDIVVDAFGDKRKVIDTLEYSIDEDIIELQFDDGRIIECTLDHEILTENRGWVQAKDLNEYDEIVEI